MKNFNLKKIKSKNFKNKFTKIFLYVGMSKKKLKFVLLL